MGKLQQAVLAAVDADQIVDLTRELVKLPSITGEEAEVAGHMADVFSDMGLNVESIEVEPGRPNVIGTLPGPRDGRTLVLNGHTDVVPPGEGWSRDPFSGELVDGKIHGRGATDMKGGLAAMVGAVQAIQRTGATLGGTLMLTAVVGEERDQIGTRRLVEDGLQADFAVITEPTELAPVIAHKGDLYYEIWVKGRAAHSSRPDAGINAIDKMAGIIVALRELAVEMTRKNHPLLGTPTLSVGTISGGVETSMVPDRCCITVDRRLLPGEALEEADAELQQVLGRLCAEDKELRVNLERIMTAPAMETPAETAVAQSVRQAAARVLGYVPDFRGEPGTTDANWLVNAADIPTVIFGPGSVAQAHQVDEFIEVDQIVKATQVLALVILDLLGLSQ